MKFLLRILILYFSVLIASIAATTTSGNFGSLSAQEAQQQLDATSDNRMRLAFVKAAIDARRMDLLQICFQDQHAGTFLVPEVKKLQDSSFRDQITLMLLTTPSPYWPPETLVGSRGVAGIEQPFISTLEKYLPNLSLNAHLLETQNARQNIASQLQQAMRTYPQGAPKEKTPVNVSATPLSGATPVAVTKATTPLPEEIKHDSPTEQTLSRNSSRNLWAGLAVLILAAGVYIARRTGK